MCYITSVLIYNLSRFYRIVCGLFILSSVLTVSCSLMLIACSRFRVRFLLIHASDFYLSRFLLYTLNVQITYIVRVMFVLYSTYSTYEPLITYVLNNSKFTITNIF